MNNAVQVNYFGCRFGADANEHEGIREYKCKHPLNEFGGHCNLQNKYDGEKADCSLLPIDLIKEGRKKVKHSTPHRK